MDENNKSSSRDLLSCGNGGGLAEKLLLKSSEGLKTERVPRSNVMARLQSFLPQMAEANRKLKQQMEESPGGHFDIEDVQTAEKVIEMDIALVELSGSDADSEDDDDRDSSDSESETVLTERNLKLPGRKCKEENVNIQVVEHPDK
ncbi:uncharacterized protein C12orf45 homolog [Syngnathoides biaculeatus]|uniref:uncharacterized protein C12orf45 homolog n=1 Tax=Syngnathoides biaculeatus TaxID=300417 RepID=UPI002ADD79C7|nr:uncharacterized protein C12orf45 homolog [Syngnathoides biaculeatus]